MAQADLRFHRSPTVAVGGSYSHAVLDEHHCYLAGQLAVDAPGGRPAGIATETRAVMELLGRVLADLGLGFGDVLRTGVFMTDLGEFAAMDEVYRGYFAAGRLPARTCVQVAGLIGGCHVEIDGVARLPR